MVLTAYFVLSPAIGLDCHRPPRECPGFDAGVEASGPHDFTVRAGAVRLAAPPASKASRPASVTIAIRPFVGWDEYGYEVIWVRRKQKYFFDEDWTTQISLIRFDKLDFARKVVCANFALVKAQEGADAIAGRRKRRRGNMPLRRDAFTPWPPHPPSDIHKP
jgi:hypothetical protein